MNKKKKSYTVHLQFEAYGFDVMATSEAEARQKALNKLSRKTLKSMLDKNNTFISRSFRE